MALQYHFPPTKVPNFFVQYLLARQVTSCAPQEADFLVLPFMYEIIHDFRPEKLTALGLTQADLTDLQQIAIALNSLSVSTGKKLIVFFYRDPEIDLPFDNALVFRTSYRAGLQRPHVFGLPAFVDDFATAPEQTWLPKEEVPAVFFAGKTAPETLPLSWLVRGKINRVLQGMCLPYRVKNWSPEGYFLRRRAMRSCLRAGQRVKARFYWNPDTRQEGYHQTFVQAFSQTPYCICAAGFGNYSFRLYEVLKAGRIPVYIDTDELLPCRDVLPWHDMMLWIPARKADRTAQYLLKYHARVSAPDFIQRQKDNAALYRKYLTRTGFSQYLHEVFLPKYPMEAA